MFCCKKCRIKCNYEHESQLCSFCGKREFPKKRKFSGKWFGGADLTKTSPGYGKPKRYRGLISHINQKY